MDLVQIMALLRQQTAQIERLNAQVVGQAAQIRMLRDNDEKITEFVNNLQRIVEGLSGRAQQTEEDAVIVE